MAKHQITIARYKFRSSDLQDLLVSGLESADGIESLAHKLLNDLLHGANCEMIHGLVFLEAEDAWIADVAYFVEA